VQRAELQADMLSAACIIEEMNCSILRQLHKSIPYDWLLKVSSQREHKDLQLLKLL